MKTRLYIFAIACLTTMSMTPIFAMEQPSVAPTHRLVTIINERVIDGMVTFVKKISDQYLVVFQNSGTILLYDLNNHKKYINQWRIRNNDSNEIWCVENIFLYQDRDGQSLLIAYDNDIGLHVCNLNKIYACHTIRINHAFKVVQATVGSKKTLVMINIEDDSAYPIDLTWAALEDQDKCRPSYEDLPINPIHDFNMDHVIDEGLVVDKKTLNFDEQLELPKKMFDIQLLTEEQKELILLNSLVNWKNQSLAKITCYQALNGTFYLGHYAGTVSVWEPISLDKRKLL